MQRLQQGRPRAGPVFNRAIFCLMPAARPGYTPPIFSPARRSGEPIAKPGRHSSPHPRKEREAMPHRVASRLAGLTPLFLVVAGVLAAGLLLVRPAPAEQLGRPPLPLPPVEQGKVNLAIDRGATFLLATQNPWGSWGAGKGPGGGGGHMIGYTALPALTLLECGLPA